MNKNVYKGNGDALDILQKRNPTSFLLPEELKLDERVFSLTDPIFIQKAKELTVPIQSLLK